MKERPILFSAPMVRAILDGRKTQTRRAVKPQPDSVKDFGKAVPYRRAAPPRDMPSAQYEVPIPCPYGVPGDRLWVRETWGVGNRSCPSQGWVDGIEYRADCVGDEVPPLFEIIPGHVQADSIRAGWRPSIHMPRWASRITLEVTDVRVERLQDISETDAMAEGIAEYPDGFHWEPNPEPAYCRLIGRTAQRAFLGLWEQINGVESVEANPWVWVVEFKRVTP